MFERLSRSDSSTDLGPEQIIDAVYGNTAVTDAETAVMGTPQLRDFGSEYTTDYYVVIPLYADPEITLSPFLFDLPDDPELDGGLGELAGFFGITEIDGIAGLEGQTVPIEWPEGYPRPNLNVLRSEQ